MERQCRLRQQGAADAVVVRLGIEQEISKIDQQQQAGLAYSPIGDAERAAKQQQNGGQDVEQRGEELIET